MILNNTLTNYTVIEDNGTIATLRKNQIVYQPHNMINDGSYIISIIERDCIQYIIDTQYLEQGLGFNTIIDEDTNTLYHKSILPLGVDDHELYNTMFQQQQLLYTLGYHTTNTIVQGYIALTRSIDNPTTLQQALNILIGLIVIGGSLHIQGDSIQRVQITVPISTNTAHKEDMIQTMISIIQNNMISITIQRQTKAVGYIYQINSTDRELINIISQLFELEYDLYGTREQKVYSWIQSQGLIMPDINIIKLIKK